jgi:uncharacterized protein YdhG (YjbR/CyaY superfamily)
VHNVRGPAKTKGNTPVRKMSSKRSPEKNGPAKTVDDYIAAAPRETQVKLAQLRKVIKAAAPGADEYISYGMPFYRQGEARVAFAAFKNHIGFFGVSSVIAEHRQELAGYRQTAKGTIHFPIDKPLPVALIGKLVKARIKKNNVEIAIPAPTHP